MMRLFCGENLMEYAGDGYFQCRKHIRCPKKHNNRILGFDCIVYIDNLPEGVDLVYPESRSDEESKDDEHLIDLHVLQSLQRQKSIVEG